MIHKADNVAIRMARTLANAGLAVRMYLARDEWTIVASHGDRQLGFGFRVHVANLLSDPERYADYHARRMIDGFNEEPTDEP